MNGRIGEKTISEITGLRPEVIWFAVQMEKKLRENDHKSHWSEKNYEYLIERLKEEVKELEVVTAALEKKEYPSDITRIKGRIVREAADVANFAMMIADNSARL